MQIGIGIGLSNVAAAARMSIAALFSAQPGRVGAYYGAASDPSITAMIAENRKALGLELVENAEFANDISGWSSTGTGVPSWVDGRLRRTSPGGSGGSYRDIPVTPGKPHWIETSIRLVSGAGAFGLWAYNGAGFVNPLVGSFTQGGTIVVPTASVMRIYLYSDSVSVCDFDRASVHEIADWSKLIAFADPAGTVPLLSVHQADRGFGLLLDRSKGLVRGAELFADANATFTGASSRVSPGVYRVYTPDGAYSLVGFGPTAVAGRWYEVTFNVDSVAAAGNGLQIETTVNVPTIPSTVGPKRVLVQAGGATLGIKRASTATDVQISGVSVRELPGNHYVQPTATGRGEITARVNQWTASEDIQLATWTKGGTVPVDAEFLREDTTTGTHQVFQGLSVPAVADVVFRCELKAAGRTKVAFGGNWVFSTIIVDLGTGVVSGSGAALVTTTMLADGWVRCVFRGAPPDTTGRSYLIRLLGPGDASSYLGDGASGVRIRKADWRFSADAIPSIPAYQWTGSTSTDYDSVGFPVRWRGQTDDFGKTHINPSGATKALVVWAGQKASDAAVGIVVESSSDSSATNGTLALFAPNTAGQPRYMLRSRGTATSEAQDSTHPAPGRDVIRAQTGIATDVADLYVDGALAAQSATDQGTGAYTEQDVFFWSRAGTSQFFNGYASTLPMLLFMQPGDPGLSAGEKKQLDKAYAKAGGVTL